MSDHLNLSEIEQNLHATVARFCAAPRDSRAQVFTELVCLASQLVSLEGGLSRASTLPQPEPAPVQQAAPGPPALPVLTGPFLRLCQGGRLVHEGGEHFVTEEDAAKRCLQHGDLIEATPTADGGYTYRAVCAGPMSAPSAREAIGHIVPVDDDLALACCSLGVEVLLSTRDMQRRGAKYGSPVSVRFLPDAQVDGRYLGRVLKLFPTGEAPSAAAPRSPRRKRDDHEPEPDLEPANFPQFDLIDGRRPTIAIVGGQPELLSNLSKILDDYGADHRPLPFKPTREQIETAVKASDLVIGLTQSCRTGQWKSLIQNARKLKKCWRNAKSQNESGLRLQIETEIIPKWRKWRATGDAAD